jgi:hypothetical protein
MGASTSTPSTEPTMWQRLTGSISSAATSVKDTVTGAMPVSKPLVEPVPVVASEAPGVTSSGGRRHKTKKQHKSPSKTRRQRRRGGKY